MKIFKRAVRSKREKGRGLDFTR